MCISSRLTRSYFALISSSPLFFLPFSPLAPLTPSSGLAISSETFFFRLVETLLADSDSLQKLFDLWLVADSLPTKWDVSTQFLPRFGPLLFIDSLGGFTPYSSSFTCSTFSYVTGDINDNGRVSNVDLCHLAEYLLESSSSSKRVSSHPFCDPSSLRGETAFNNDSIRFIGDVNGDTCVDAGDIHYLARYLQAPDYLKDSLQYG